MKKILLFLIVGIVVLGGLGAGVRSIDNKTQLIDKVGVITLFDDELDQSQTEITENITLPVGQILLGEDVYNIQLAQSFIPAKEVITRVELLIGKNITATHPLIVSIREELTDEDIVSVSVNPEQVPTQVFDWVEVDFNDTHITIGQTYYIVALTENTTDNYYGWYGNTDPESYPFGCLWYSVDDGNTWSNKSSSSNPDNPEDWVCNHENTRFDENDTWDLCFKTYGRDNMAPGAPTITGPPSGKPGTLYEYTLNSVDPENDNVKYIIDWGDGKTNTTALSSSGQDIKVAHTWEKKGTYTIKAKAQDIDGLTGPEATLSVKMPRNLAMNILFLNYLQTHLNLFPILQKIIQRLRLQ